MKELSNSEAGRLIIGAGTERLDKTIADMGSE